jgi:hypothetical protein
MEDSMDDPGRTIASSQNNALGHRDMGGGVMQPFRESAAPSEVHEEPRIYVVTEVWMRQHQVKAHSESQAYDLGEPRDLDAHGDLYFSNWHVHEVKG